MLHPVISFGPCQRIDLAPHRIPAKLSFSDTGKIILPKFLISDSRNRHRIVGFPLSMGRYIGPFIPIMPDQIIAHPVRHHHFCTFKFHIFYWEHHILIKKKWTTAPSHSIARTVFFLVGKHDLLQFLQCSVFSQESIGKKPA